MTSLGTLTPFTLMMWAKFDFSGGLYLPHTQHLSFSHISSSESSEMDADAIPFEVVGICLCIMFKWCNKWF